ncbi:pyrroline-5-carboxylate reductase [Rhodoluna sp.]|uniref:pyrroline-5-carboxylate reductase n=1 Tax=Rhodoluna sp. TaxID=1969481 RepID=UPI0025EE8CBD|nr:pyrroline-5-carboxylate reductase [Rhodoluna sp.]
MNISRIAILGTGSMGGAILAGLIKSGFEPSNISVTTNSDASATALAEQFGVLTFALENGEDANQMAVAGADVILVGVKPAYVTEVLADVADSLNDDALVVSVAAGITTAAMQAVLPADVAVVRAMPNTPAIVGLAVTGVAPGSRASAENVETAKQLFETVGKVIVLGEDKIDELGTISGSGPAYVFYLVEKLTEAAKAHGFSDADAALMVNETFLGAAKLLVESGKSPQELRKQVTSPNGTTERAIARFDQTDLTAMFVEGTQAALARSRELASGK